MIKKFRVHHHASFFYGLGLIGQEADGEYTSYHFDYRGSTVALTDSSGQIVEQYQYSPYGLLLSGDASKTPFLFNGKYGVMTDSNNLYYMRARFYSPEIRRFVNQDILLGDVFEGQTLNRYAFVTGRPVSFVDPFGLFQVTPKSARDLQKLGLIITQADSPVVGPADVVGLIIILAGSGLDIYLSLQDDFPTWEGEGWNEWPTHADVDDSIACANTGGSGGDCGAIGYAIDTIVRSLRFRRGDMQRYVRELGKAYMRTKDYKTHVFRFNIEQLALQELLRLAKLLKCKYNPQADIEAYASHK